MRFRPRILVVALLLVAALFPGLAPGAAAQPRMLRWGYVVT